MENKKIGFALVALKTEQFASFEENYKEGKKVDLKTGLEFKINVEDKNIGVFVTFTFEQSKKAFLKVQVSGHFSITEEAFNEFSKEDKIIFPKGFMCHLTMLVVSSARGILHAKTEGSNFNKFLLPTIDVTKIVSDDIEFHLSE